jgi:hypothetical protein
METNTHEHHQPTHVVVHKKLALPKISGRGKSLYNPQHIICCEGDREYTHVYQIATEPPFWKKLPDVTYNLGCFEEWLYAYGFQRVCKSIVANLHYVTDWEVEDDSTYITLQYNCCGRIKLGPKWRDEFFSRLLINYNANPLCPFLCCFGFFVC